MNKLITLFFSSCFYLGSLHACTVCFGGADSDLRKGFTWGISILLLLPFALAAGIGAMIVFSSRKKNRHV